MDKQTVCLSILKHFPLPHGMMSPTMIASRYRTGHIFDSIWGSNLAAGIQIGLMRSIRGASQMLLEYGASSPDERARMEAGGKKNQCECE
ncbi:MAG: hypothetical protein OQK51_07060 [Kangiellaceae bacterium]|nr:hypothetical protein [Kangiellaceae bacterium]